MSHIVDRDPSELAKSGTIDATEKLNRAYSSTTSLPLVPFALKVNLSFVEPCNPAAVPTALPPGTGVPALDAFAVTVAVVVVVVVVASFSFASFMLLASAAVGGLIARCGYLTLYSLMARREASYILQQCTLAK